MHSTRRSTCYHWIPRGQIRHASLPDGVRHIEQLHPTTDPQISEAIHFPRSFTLAKMAAYFYEKLSGEREEGRFLRLLPGKMPDTVTIDIFHAYWYPESSHNSESESSSTEVADAEIDSHMMARDLPENISIKDVDGHLARGLGILTLEKLTCHVEGLPASIRRPSELSIQMT